MKNTKQGVVAQDSHTNKSAVRIVGCIWGFMMLVAAYFLVYILILSNPKGIQVAELVEAGKPPRQVNIPSNEATSIQVNHWSYNGSLFPKAKYSIAARVLGVHRYYLDFQAPLMPIDIALGWGEVSDPGVDEYITWSQSRRWYHFTVTDDSPYSVEFISKRSSNVHVIPASENIRAAISKIRSDDEIFMEGLLVDVNLSMLFTDFHVTTSLTRDDTGSGACEILYVQRLVVEGMEYK
jgi:hypothetical protein